MSKQRGYGRVQVLLGGCGIVFWVAFVAIGARLEALESTEGKKVPPANLLGDPGFEGLKERLSGRPMILKQGEPVRLGGWDFSCDGKVRVSAGTKEVSEGEVSLMVEFLDSQSNNEVTIAQRSIAVKPNTIYELRGMIKPYNLKNDAWVMSHCQITEYAEGSVGAIGGGQRRLINYAGSSRFLERKTWYATGPRTNRLDLMIRWRGRPLRTGVILKRSMLWMDDMHFEEVGPVYPVSEEYLRDDFEAEDLQNWLIVQLACDPSLTALEPGPGDKRSPHISDERAHSGRGSLKLSDVWGIVERPFAQRITNCVVTVWFYDEMGAVSNRCRMVMLVDEDGMEVGLGLHYESTGNYSCFFGGRPQITDIERSSGWHEFKLDVSDGKGITCYIDGTEVGQTDQIDGFRVLQLGQNFWRGATCYMDDVSIQLKEQR